MREETHLDNLEVEIFIILIGYFIYLTILTLCENHSKFRVLLFLIIYKDFYSY